MSQENNKVIAEPTHSEWIKIESDHPVKENFVCEWLHPEYGVIEGSIVTYSGCKENGWKESKWIYPEPDPHSQADIALSEFTHVRKPIKKQVPTMNEPQTPEQKAHNDAIEKAIQAAYATPEYFTKEGQKHFIEILKKMLK